MLTAYTPPEQWELDKRWRVPAATPIADAIRFELRCDGDMTFYELRKHVYGFEGTADVGLDGFAGLILGIGVSAEGVAALNKLLVAHEVHYHHRTDLLSVFLQGEILRLPVARGLRSYKKPHWLPTYVVNGPIARCKSAECRKITAAKKRRAAKEAR